jgi:hypothetical protein
MTLRVSGVSSGAVSVATGNGYRLPSAFVAGLLICEPANFVQVGELRYTCVPVARSKLGMCTVSREPVQSPSPSIGMCAV